MEIKSLDQFASLIESLNSNKKDVFFYRGCGNHKYELLPSLYRHKEKKTIQEVIKLEQKILDRFKHRSIPYLSQPVLNEADWQYLFLMQHYGVPTRLLDWSENPYIALFFALTLADYNYNKKKYKSDASFWILNATQWNKKVIDKDTYDGEILTHSNILLKGYSPMIACEQLNKNPVAIYGEYNSQRIVAQRGAFTIFGSDLSPMEKVKRKEKFPNDILSKYLIKKDFIPELLNSLLVIGFTDSVIFPDLEGLSKEIKRLYKFEVGYV